MNTKRASALSMVLLLVLPTLVILAPSSAAQVRVPDAEGDIPVHYDGVETTTKLWLRDLSSEAAADRRQGLSPVQPPSATQQNGQPGTDYGDDFPRPRTKTYQTIPVESGQEPDEDDLRNAPAGSKAIFTFDPFSSGAFSQGLRHATTIRGPNAVWVELFVTSDVDSSLDPTVALRYDLDLFERKADGSPDVHVASKKGVQSQQGGSQTSPDVLRATLDVTGDQHEFSAGSKIILRVVATRSTGLDGIVSTGTWTLYYDEKDQTPSRLELITQDGLRVATWTQNRVSNTQQEAEVTKLFRNWTNRDDYADLVRANKYIHVVDGWFVAESAFGLADAQNLKTPSAQIIQDNEEVEFKPWRDTATCRLSAVNIVPMTEVGSGDDGAGKRIWRFQRLGDADASSCLDRDWWHYNRTVDGKAAGGSYQLRVDTFYDQTRSANTGGAPRVRDTFNFDISAVRVSLKPFSYIEDTTGNLISETSLHRVAAGGSTTFLLNLTNGGSANDTITINVERLNQIPLDAGFTHEPLVARIGDAQQVGANSFRLGPTNSTILTFTVRAPADADATASYRITAKSTLDPNAEEAESTSVVNVAAFDPASPPNVHGVGLIAGTNDIVEVSQGGSRDASLFVWNRGVLPADINVNLTPPEGFDDWDADLVDAGRVTENVVVRQVPPGSISGVVVRFTTTNAAVGDYTITATAAAVDASVDEALAQVRARVDIVEAFGFDILRGINDEIHWMEAIASGSVSADYVNGTYYRVWLTNNQQNDRTFTLRTPTVTESPRPNPGEPNIWSAQWGYRTQTGEFRQIADNRVDVKKGQTLEVYVWVGRAQADNAQARANPVQTVQVTMTIVDSDGNLQSKQVTIQVESIDRVQARRMGALIEPVERLALTPGDPATMFAINRSEEKERRSVRHIDASGFATYRLRVTNGASWWAFSDLTSGSWDHRLQVSLLNVDTDLGWSAYWRPVPAVGSSDAALPTDCTSSVLEDPQKWNPAEEAKKYPPLNGNLAPTGMTNFGREGFWDMEVEVVVCPPTSTAQQRSAAAAREEVLLEVTQLGPDSAIARDFHTLETVIEKVPSISITPRFPPSGDRFVTQTGGEAIIPVYISNDGTYLTNVTLRADLEGSGWFMSGSPVLNITPLKAFENRTVTFRVRAPTEGVSPATVTFTADYLRNLYDPSSQPLQAGPIAADIESTTAPLTFDMKFGQSSGACAGSDTAVTCTAQLPATSDGQIDPVPIPIRVTNTGANPLTLRISSPTMPGWTFASPDGGDRYTYSDTRTISGTGSGDNVYPTVITVTPPRDAVAGSVTDVVITAFEEGNEENTRSIAARIVIAGGVLLTDLRVERTRDYVERDNTVSFPVTIRNDGNVDGMVRLTTEIFGIDRVEGINDARLCAKEQAHCWKAWIESVGDTQLVDANGTSRIFTPDMRASSATYFLVKGETLRFNLTMYAPYFEQENAKAQALLRIRNASSAEELGTALVTGEIQDYGTKVEPLVDQLTVLPGLGGTMRVRITNTGDTNDTLNISVDTGGLPWTWRFSSDQVFLAPGTTTSVLLTVQTPVDPLPTPRTAKFFVYLGSVNGHVVNKSEYDISPLYVTVPQYRQLDVDNDNITELAVDENRDLADGYERFVEYTDLVRLTQAVERAKGPDGKYKHFVDIPPTGGTYDGVADVYWDPDQNFMTRITITFDLDREGSPDYLIDSDGDGVVDAAYQSATKQFLGAEPVQILSDRGATQYLIDQTGDGKPNRYYDPAQNILTRVVSAPDLGSNMYGVDTDNDGVVDRYYNTRTKVSTPAESVNLMDLAGKYWYLFAGFLAVVVLFGVVLIRRRAV